MLNGNELFQKSSQVPQKMGGNRTQVSIPKSFELFWKNTFFEKSFSFLIANLDIFLFRNPVFSKKLNLLGVHPLVISSLYIILTALIAAYLRRLVKAWTNDNILRQMLLEFVATAELCASCFELIIGR